ncbi:LysE family transporter [Acinetobacter sp. YH12097]|uniref:LysE family translocator n=1 Tax=Acinetobacter sp. YH12097 TaxID=2601086 RepID=UPI0015D42AAA
MEIFLYTLSVMYSPGPVNFMGLNSGLTGQLKKTVGFYIGVGFAMLILFVLFGYIGEAVIPHGWIHYIALVGALYTFYLAIKMIRANVETTQQQENHLTFLNGLLIQLLNPKAILVILPVTTIMYPAAKITGIMIFIVSLLISLAAVGAPFTYALFGKILGKKIADPVWFNRLNKLMGILLILSGLFMFKDFLNGINLL